MKEKKTIFEFSSPESLIIICLTRLFGLVYFTTFSNMYGVVLIVVLLFQQINSEVDFIREKEIGFDCVYFGVSSLAISLKVSVL